MKEVLQALVDDGLVDNDKIGAGNFFWALPSKQQRVLQSQKEKAQQTIQQNEKKVQGRKQVDTERQPIK